MVCDNDIQRDESDERGTTMAGYTMRVTRPGPFDEAVTTTRQALAKAGFGILTEIDMQSTLAEKLGVDTPPQLILGACNPVFAHRATQADASIAALLPCNVVVRQEAAGSVTIEAFDPAAMARLSDADGLRDTADEVRSLLRDALNDIAATGTTAS